jgi:hypothetical protein
MDFLKTDKAQDLLTELLSGHLEHIKNDLTNTEVEVLSQKSRFYKFWCWFVYGHLYKKGTCLRCGMIKLV